MDFKLGFGFWGDFGGVRKIFDKIFLKITIFLKKRLDFQLTFL